jgi:peptidoglycan/LPS O-acetylase OafA/YrhL
MTTTATPATAATAPLRREGAGRFPNFRELLWPKSGAANEIPALDGLRGVAVLLVLTVHACFELRRQTSDGRLRSLLDATSVLWGFGGTGVHLFFVLSGFLLITPFARAALGMGASPSVRRFYARRALRILPAYWASLAILVFCFSPVYLVTRPCDLLLHVALLHNWSEGTLHSIDGPYWTLAFEWQFYLMLPLIGAVAARAVRGRRFSVPALIAVLLLGSGTAVSVAKVLLRRALPAVADHLCLLDAVGFLSVFGAGMVAGFVYQLAARSAGPGIATRRAFRAGALAGVGLLGLHTALAGANAPLHRFDYLFFGAFAGVCYAAILLGVLGGYASWAKVLSRPSIRFVGFISYSLYLWHYPVYQYLVIPIAARHGRGITAVLLTGAGSLLIVLPLGYLSYQFTERPFLRARRVCE